MNSTASPLQFRPEFPWLAPLAGYTDLPFRILCREQGAAVACTEMVSAKGLVYAARRRKTALREVQPDAFVPEDLAATEELLATTPLPGFPALAEADTPLVVQLFGAEAEFLEQAAVIVLDRGFSFLDLNMGCSVPKVVRTGAGAALLKDEEAALKAAKALIKVAGAGKVGCKLRLGWDAAKTNYLSLARRLEDAGAAWLTLHPRYARQGFSGQADWRALKELKGAVSVPVIASGDLFSAQDAINCLQESGVDALMFGRGAMHSPLVFENYLRLLRGGDPLAAGDPGVIKKLILRHAELMRAFAACREQSGTGKVRRKPGRHIDGALLKMRGIVPRYVRELPGCKGLRAKFVQCTDWAEFYNLLDKFFV